MDIDISRVFILSLALTIVGCGGYTSEDVIESRKSGQKAYADALQSMASKDYAAAKQLLEQALEHGRLQLDIKASALVKHAICIAADGDTAAAHSKLDELEQQAPNLDEIFAARSFVFEKEGKARDARAAWSKARRINRYVERISD